MANKVTHSAIWAALEELAKSKGMTPSGVAVKAGLDATVFNRSKRISPKGRPHWPSTESIARVLNAVGASWGEFSKLVAGEGNLAFKIPLIGLAEAGSSGYFDDGGHPTGGGWDFIGFEDNSLYALDVSGNSMEPEHKAGDTVIVSSSEQVRGGDKVILKTTKGEVMFKVLVRQNTERVVVKSLNPRFDNQEIPQKKVDWIHRVIWASQ